MPFPTMDTEAVSTPRTTCQQARRLAAVRMRRRVSLFRRVGLVAQQTNNDYEIVRAVTAEDLRAAYQLVHDVFVYQRYITPQQSGMRVRIYEALPEMATYVAKVNGRIVGVMSVVPDSQELGLPSDRVFGKELMKLRRDGRNIGEVTNLAVVDEYHKSTVLLELSRCICGHAMNIGLDDLFISVSPGHSGFFETILQFDPWGEARNYGIDNVDMVEGKRLNVNEIETRARQADSLLGDQAFLYDWFVGENPWLKQNMLPMTWADRATNQIETFRQLFGASGELLAHLSPNQLQVLRRRWGGAVYQAVFGQSATNLPMVRVKA